MESGYPRRPRQKMDCCRLNTFPLQNFYVEISFMMVLGVGAFGRCLEHEGGALMNRISAYKRGFREIPSPFHSVGHRDRHQL